MGIVIEKLWFAEKDMWYAAVSQGTAILSAKGETSIQTYTAEQDGYFTVWIDELHISTPVDLRVIDENGKSSYVYVDENGEYISTYGEAGKTYQIEMKAARGACTFDFHIGAPKPVEDISGLSLVLDRTEYSDQTNVYTFVPAYDGVYRFEFGEITKGSVLEAVVTNRLGEKMGSDYYIENGEGVTATLKAGEQYTITVQQLRGFTEYEMRIGHQKPTVDISGAGTVKDSTEFTDQTNVYILIPEKDGEYRFTFSEITKGAVLEAVITNHLGEKAASDYYIENGEVIKASLKAGERYTVTVSQSRATTDYIMIIE